MEYKDYYQIMGVSRNAGKDEIKRAYRKLARKYHPDVSKEPDAEARFKEVHEAYEVLKDNEKRAAYDQLGQNWKAGQNFRPPPDWDKGFEFHGGGFTHADSAQFSDFFESLFGGGFTRSNFDAQGQDTFANILIDLEDSYNGAVRNITLNHVVLDKDSRPVTKERTLSVHIPKGIYPGQHIRLVGQGSPGIGQGKQGDLYLKVEFNRHRLYRVENKDVYLDLPVAPWELALGETVTVPTPSGFIELKIPVNSMPNKPLRIKKRGIPGNPAGDFYVVLQVVIPPADSAQAKAFYQTMKQELAFDPRRQWRLK